MLGAQLLSATIIASAASSVLGYVSAYLILCKNLKEGESTTINYIGVRRETGRGEKTKGGWEAT